MMSGERQKLLRDGGEVSVNTMWNQNPLVLMSGEQEIARLSWVRPAPVIAHFDLSDRRYEIRALKQMPAVRGLEAYWAGEAVARLEIGRLGRVKRLVTRTGQIYVLRKKGGAVQVERDGMREVILGIGGRQAAHGRKLKLYGTEMSEEEYWGLFALLLAYVALGDRNQDIAIYGAAIGGLGG
jgi:hypothetical protein